MRPRLALLNVAHDPADTRRNFRRELDADLVEFDVTDGQLPDGPDGERGDRTRATGGLDGAVVTGSKSSVYDDEPWIDPLLDWLAAADRRGLPLLGVCFGHQALAAALGGRVEHMGEFELGYRRVDRTGADDLLTGLDDSFTVFTTHQDRVVELPPGADRIATNDYGVHGFRRGRSWGVQFHPEYDRETAASVARGKEQFVGADGVAAVLEGITDESYAAACETKRLFDNFVGIVRAATGDRDGDDEGDGASPEAA
jgi:GMP synthase (glutamine-hydrolysing)